MNVSKALSLGLAALTAFAVSTPKVKAHNQAKYIGVPFIVGASCPNLDPGVSSSFVNSGGKLQLRMVVNGEQQSGFGMYTSFPGSGMSNNIAQSSFPQGVLTFSESGLPSNGTINAFVLYSDNSDIATTPSFTNGFVTIPANSPMTPGATVVGISVDFQNGSGTTGNYSTVTLSNFTYGGKPVLFDTTLVITDGCPT